jgi:hypothetical protein
MKGLTLPIHSLKGFVKGCGDDQIIPVRMLCTAERST